MRRFRFIGDELDANGYGKKQPCVGVVYNEDEIFCDCSVLDWSKDNFLKICDEWQEVFEEKPMITDSPVTFTSHSNPLHKDTDLGYFAGLAMQGLLANPNRVKDIGGGEVKNAILIAKELIKQLNEETK